MPKWGLAVVRGRSMEPTLRDGDRLLVRYGAQVRLDELVLVRFPARPLAVKRVVRRDPVGWWVERDNARSGVDSWLLGAVPESDVVAVVVCRIWPLIRRRTLTAGAGIRSANARRLRR